MIPRLCRVLPYPYSHRSSPWDRLPTQGWWISRQSRVLYGRSPRFFSRQIRDDRVGCERGRETVVARRGCSSPGDATSDETDQSATTGSKGECPLSTLRVRLEEPRRVCRSNRAGFDRSNRRHPPGIILSAPRSNRDALLIIYLTQDPLEYEARRGEGSRWRESRSYVSRRPPTLHVVCVSTSPFHKQTVDRIRARGV